MHTTLNVLRNEKTVVICREILSFEQFYAWIEICKWCFCFFIVYSAAYNGIQKHIHSYIYSHNHSPLSNCGSISIGQKLNLMLTRIERIVGKQSQYTQIWHRSWCACRSEWIKKLKSLKREHGNLKNSNLKINIVKNAYFFLCVFRLYVDWALTVMRWRSCMCMPKTNAWTVQTKNECGRKREVNGDGGGGVG